MNNGYQLHWLGNHFANCYSYNKNYCLNGIDFEDSLLFNYENLSFLKKTPFQPIFSKVSNIFNFNIENMIIFKSNDALGKFYHYYKIYFETTEGNFFLIHDLKTHWPYLVDDNCEFEKNYGKTNVIGIKKAYNCNKSQIIKLSDLITKKDPDAIVIFQSDHNWELSYENEEIYGNRKLFFNLIRFNPECRKYYKQMINHLKTIKSAIYCATDTYSYFEQQK